MSEQEPKSFWTSLPGCITAVAGLITAIGSLFIALNQVGLLDFNIPQTVIKECRTIINDPNPPINVREKPNGRILGTLPNQTPVTVKRNEGAWLVIDYNGRDGYIFGKLTEENC